MEFTIWQAQNAEQDLESAQADLFRLREAAEAARVRADASEAKYMELREKAKKARAEANAKVLELAAKRGLPEPVGPGCKPPWWENVTHAVEVIEDYDSNQCGVFSVHVGQRLFVLHDLPGEWKYGVMPGRGDAFGWFPSKCVQPAPPLKK